MSPFDGLWHSETVCLAKCAWLLPWYSTNHVTPLSGVYPGWFPDLVVSYIGAGTAPSH